MHLTAGKESVRCALTTCNHSVGVSGWVAAVGQGVFSRVLSRQHVDGRFHNTNTAAQNKENEGEHEVLLNITDVNTVATHFQGTLLNNLLLFSSPWAEVLVEGLSPICNNEASRKKSGRSWAD